MRAFDYLRGHARMEPEISMAIDRVIRSGKLILGPEGEAFEREFAAFTGSEFGVAVGSGTDALILAMMAVGVEPGDEVITVANTAVPTASAIRAVGAVPRFVDIDAETLLMDVSQLPSCITAKTRCVIPVHLHGFPMDMSSLTAIANDHGLKIIEDCAHAHGAARDGRHAGCDGDIGCFSFYPTKNLGAYGDGGICITSDQLLAERLRSLRMYGFRRGQPVAHTDGRNSRLDEIQAAILRVKLRHLEHAVSKRQKNALQYRRLLSQWPEILPPASKAGIAVAWHQFVVRLDDRDAMVAAFEKNEIGYGIHYAQPLHTMPAFQRNDGPVSLPVTEEMANRILSLPMFPELRSDEIQRVCQEITRVLCATSATKGAMQ
ncbi:MAG: DegT/DnrJ/EryC1/StrS family aminotransferase [Planctomycetaceae bacterium]|nr:DegT/DnrJ/EryC1/StrS family aminotransferase [Planctomycetaceae bacterium]